MEINRRNASGYVRDEEAFELAKRFTQHRFFNTYHFILLEWHPEANYFMIGYLSYYSHEMVSSEKGKFQRLTKDNIGLPHKYWTLRYEIELDADGNYAIIRDKDGSSFPPENHPNWQEIDKASCQREIFETDDYWEKLKGTNHDYYD